MKSLIQLLLLASVTVSFIACSNGGDDKPKAPTSPTFTQEEYNQDNINLQSTEEGLEASGLKIVIIDDPSGDPNKRMMKWDVKTFTTYNLNHTPLKPKETIELLQNYLNVLTHFMSKYNGDYYVNSKDGSVKHLKLTDEFSALSKAKIGFVKSTIEYLSGTPN